MVVGVLPSWECPRRLFVGAKIVAAPELLLVDPMAALHLPVLLGTAGPDISMVDSGLCYGERKRQGKFGSIVGLELLDGKGEGAPELAQE